MISYFFFLLIPTWVVSFEQTPVPIQILMALLYLFFMGTQWFLLGKEIDHRLKIYFRTNSSMDRVIYRILTGKMALILHFIALSYLPSPLLHYAFWGTWIALGLFYSWPTRGKIIQETITSNFTEFRFLDSLEKTVLFLCCFLFLISIPEFPGLTSVEALKLIIDPHEKIGPFFWNFMAIHYLPFSQYPMISKMAWSLHFYCFGLIMFTLTFYALLRYFFSRRISILGVFVIMSSWSYPKLLSANLHWAMTSTYFVMWIWAILWATKSQTYRCGLFLGLLSFWGTIINPSYIVLMPVQLFLLYFLFFKDQTSWFKNQMLKYNAFGITFSLLAFNANKNSLQWVQGTVSQDFFSRLAAATDQKAFFTLSIFGLALMALKLMGLFSQKQASLVENWQINTIKLKEFSLSFFSVLCLSFFIDNVLLYGFTILWILCFLSIIPLEWIFQSLPKLRSKRNLIYGIYILLALLDSRIEERIKIFIKAVSFHVL